MKIVCATNEVVMNANLVMIDEMSSKLVTCNLFRLRWSWHRLTVTCR